MLCPIEAGAMAAPRVDATHGSTPLPVTRPLRIDQALTDSRCRRPPTIDPSARKASARPTRHRRDEENECDAYQETCGNPSKKLRIEAGADEDKGQQLLAAAK